MRRRRRRAVLVAAVAVAGSSACQPQAPPAGAPATYSTPVGQVRTYPVPTRDHVTQAPSYAQHPPVGGDHFLAWATCGVYDQEVPEGHAVHSLEHGAVWLTVRKPLSAADRAVVRRLAAGQYVLVSPYPRQEAPVVLSAWGVQMAVESVQDPRVRTFLRTYVQGPQTPEPGASCSGGWTPGSDVGPSPTTGDDQI